ncbi:hypothetical protein [Phenylobacterium sp.]|uniref:hypothetical protein n=1 Tax=Phenylobacterium sp. TaxID=1871053 RepID=UPI0025EABD6F|nr:hypothetical protein [Phenylobacterium sp.]
MTLSARTILHAPISDETALGDFVERCLRHGVSLVAIVGPDSERLEELVNDLVVGDGSDPEGFLCTTSHPNEPLDEVVNFARAWEAERAGGVEEVRL